MASTVLHDHTDDLFAQKRDERHRVQFNDISTSNQVHMCMELQSSQQLSTEYYITSMQLNAHMPPLEVHGTQNKATQLFLMDVTQTYNSNSQIFPASMDCFLMRNSAGFKHHKTHSVLLNAHSDLNIDTASTTQAFSSKCAFTSDNEMNQPIYRYRPHG